MPRVTVDNYGKYKGSISKAAAPLIFLSFLLLTVVFWPEQCITIERSDALLMALPLDKGESFELRFTHSLNLSPVTDVIEWTDDGMMLRKSIFKAFGAGIPVPADGIGTELRHTDGHYELLGIDKPLDGISITLQEIPDHHIIHRGREFSLLRLAEPGASLEIKIKRIPRVVRFVTNLLPGEIYAIF